METIFKLAYEALTPILVGALVVLVVKGLQRLGISIDAEKQAQVAKVAQDLILRFEEQAAAAAVGKAQPIGNKLEAVTTALLQRFPNISQTEAENIVHAELPKLGVGAAAVAAATFRAVATNP